MKETTRGNSNQGPMGNETQGGHSFSSLQEEVPLGREGSLEGSRGSQPPSFDGGGCRLRGRGGRIEAEKQVDEVRGYAERQPPEDQVGWLEGVVVFSSCCCGMVREEGGVGAPHQVP